MVRQVSERAKVRKQAIRLRDMAAFLGVKKRERDAAGVPSTRVMADISALEAGALALEEKAAKMREEARRSREVEPI